MYTIGIEEEYFVFDARSRRAVARVNKRFLVRARQRLGDRVTTEMLQSQIEAVTPPCRSIGEAREYLVAFREALAEAADEYGHGIAAVGTFPLAFWPEQTITPKPRYDEILNDLQMVGLRNMMCGMHVHVEVPDPDKRIDLMTRLMPYVPLLLTLSTSSPFWQGHLTGLRGYRLAAYNELPRTGLPELFRTQADFDSYISALVRAGIIPDSSFIWWTLRPSSRYPTLELRVADSCTRVDDATAIAALFRCLVRALDRDPSRNAGFDQVGRAITEENKWHAQRHGTAAAFVEPFRRCRLAAAEWLDEVIAMVSDDAAALGCEAELAYLPKVIRHGSSADEQIRVYTAAREAGRNRMTALKDVIDWAARVTRNGRASPSPSRPL